MRIVQEGVGAVRPLVLIYHVNANADAAIKAAAGLNALIANETGPTNTGYYNNVPPLQQTVAQLSAQYNAKLSPVILAGFSEGGLVTRRLLELGGDPDALIIADGTYGNNFDAWKRYATRAKNQERAMLASYSAGTTTPWRGLLAVTGFALKFGAELREPTKYEQGSLVVLGYGDGDHTAQGQVVLPKMVAAAIGAVSAGDGLPPPSKISLLEIAAYAVTAIGVGGIAYVIVRSQIPLRVHAPA